MTEIPFIDHLGDAIERAIAAPRQRRRAPWQLRRGGLVLVAVAVALAIAAIAVAHVLSSADELTTRSIACYTGPGLGGDITVVANDQAPVAACAEAYRKMGQSVPQLVACATGSIVAVIPGTSPAACARLNLQQLPAGYAASQAKTAEFARSVTALEAQHDCASPAALARSVQKLLVQQGWTGWTAEIRSPLAGPCATVTGLDGSGRRRIDGALDATRHVVMISGEASRSTMTLLYSAGGLAPTLEDESGSRCFTIAGLTALVDTRVRATGRKATVTVGPSLAGGETIAGLRGTRYKAGCAVLTDVRAADDGRNVVAVIPNPPTN
jgi:hypothetical protein